MRYLTVSEAAEALQLSVPTVKRYLYSGRLHSTKLPGGQHRIPETEIERLLGGEELEEAAPEPADDAEQRLALIERWVTDLQAEVERLQASLEVLSRFVQSIHGAAGSQPPTATHQVLVLGPGCQRCDALYDATVRVLAGAGLRDVRVERVKHLDDIVEYGPVLTPALVVDGRVVTAGRVPNDATLARMLQRHLGAVT